MKTKISRTDSIKALTYNVDMMMKSNMRNVVGVTTDTAKVDIVGFANEMASVFTANRKVAIVTYDEVETKTAGIEYVVINANMTDEDVAKAIDGYDMVVAVCPNMLVSKHYLQMAKFVKDMLFVARRWKSKTENIKTMKAIADANEINVMGIVYER